uniref:FAD_binding_4 domain-containing protein n=1 Tax=Heterorhabditis bacteriophora TaxID=37862 RepID=A0A1I7WDZ0_HETBA
MSGICIRLLKGDRLEINLSLKELRPPCKKKERSIGLLFLPCPSEYAFESTMIGGRLPSVVLVPSSVEQVSDILRLCNKNRISIVPFGTGTGLEGGSISIQVKITEFNIYSIKRVNITGVMKENILNLEVVLADGTVLYTRGKDARPRFYILIIVFYLISYLSTKSAAGLNLTDLFVGSEGTLGIITMATLRLHARPSFTSSAVCSFPTLLDTVNSVVETLQSGIPVARIGV